MIDRIYTHDNLIYDLIKFDTFNKAISFKAIGKSVNQKDIFLLKGGNGEKKMLVICGHHSLETIMSQFICDYLIKKENDFFDGITFYAIPLLNPDGADFVAKKIDINGFLHKRDRWQANYNGVDLNHNYDAGFLLAKKDVCDEGISGPNNTKYGGEEPFSEPETKIVKKLCEEIPFDLTIAFHTQGKEIYTGYCDIFPQNTEKYLDAFASACDYKYALPNKTASHAGFKDWFIKTYQKPSFTIEAGTGKNPLYTSQYNQILKDCSKILDVAVQILKST